MRRIAVCLSALLLAACSPGSPTGQQQSDPEAAISGEGGAISAAAMAQWARNCALCHVRGEGGAPVLGDATAWTERLARGEDILLKNTVEGLNNMPPLGYCMDCEEDDFREIIRFMSGGGS